MAVYFRNRTTGEVGFWIVADGELQDAYSLGTSPLNWSLVGVQPVSTFGSDGFAQDLIWQDNTGRSGVWNVRAVVDEDAGTTTYEPIPYVQLSPTQGYTSLGSLGPIGFNAWYNPTSGSVIATQANPFGNADGPLVTTQNVVIAQSSNTDWRPQIVLETGIAAGAGEGDTSLSGPTFVWRNTETNDIGLWVNITGGEGGIDSRVLVEGVSADWQVAGRGEFSGDAFQDLLWRNEVTGEVGIWTLQNTAENGVTFEAFSIGGVGTQGWEIVGTGQYSGTTDDVATDILFRNSTTGEIGYWDLDLDAEGNYTFTATSVGTASLDWEVIPTYGLGNPISGPLAPIGFDLV